MFVNGHVVRVLKCVGVDWDYFCICVKALVWTETVLALQHHFRKHSCACGPGLGGFTREWHVPSARLRVSEEKLPFNKSQLTTLSSFGGGPGEASTFGLFYEGTRRGYFCLDCHRLFKTVTSGRDDWWTVWLTLKSYQTICHGWSRSRL